VFKAEKELRAFTKVAVAAGEQVTATLSFDLADLSYWDVAEHGWVLENGDYEVLVAASAADIRLRAALRVDTGRASRSPYPAAVDRTYTTPPMRVPAAFAELLGRPLPAQHPTRRLTMEARLVDARRSIVGAVMLKAVLARVGKSYRAAVAMPDSLARDAAVKNTHFLVRMMPFNSLRSMAMSSGGALPYHVAQAIADIAAFHPLRGLRRILAGSRAARPTAAATTRKDRS
jgi:beta-glucosidase